MTCLSKVKFLWLLALLLLLCVSCSFGPPKKVLIKPVEFYSDYAEFIQTEDGYYGELDLTFDNNSSIGEFDKVSIKFFRSLSVMDEDRKFAKKGEIYSDHTYSDIELECIATNYAHHRAKFEGFCRIFVLEKTDKWMLSQEKLLVLTDLEKYGSLLFKNPKTRIIRQPHGVAERWLPINILVGATMLNPLKRGKIYKIKVLISGNNLGKSPKGFFVAVRGYHNPFEQCNGKGEVSLPQESQFYAKAERSEKRDENIVSTTDFYKNVENHLQR